MDIFTGISFCSGYDGLGIGLKEVIPNLRTILYVENEAYASGNLVEKIKNHVLDEAPIWSDIRTLPVEPFIGKVDFCHFGFPCQPHSVAGKREGGSDERWLFDEIIEKAEIINPEWILIENVRGLLTSKMPNGSYCLRYIFNRLEKAGYRLETNSGKLSMGLFSAEETGAVHERQRIFILAKLGDSSSGDGRWLSIVREYRERIEVGRSNSGACDEVEEPFCKGARYQSGKDGGDLRGQNVRQTDRTSMPIRIDTAGADELADTDSQRQSQQEGSIKKRGGRSIHNGEEKLANTCRKGQQRAKRAKPSSEGPRAPLSTVEYCNRNVGNSEKPGWATEPGRTDCELENPTCIRRRQIRDRYTSEADFTERDPEGRLIVARPGEDQHNWEYPRTVPTLPFFRWLKSRADGGIRSRGRIDQSHIEQRMGRSIDAAASGARYNQSRADQIRLLGNGVYWPTAEKAVITLLEGYFEEPEQEQLTF